MTTVRSSDSVNMWTLTDGMPDRRHAKWVDAAPVARNRESEQSVDRLRATDVRLSGKEV